MTSGLQRRSSFDLTRAATGVATLLALASIVAILVFLGYGSIPALRQEGLAFFLRNHWAYRSGVFEALAMIYGSAVVSAIALLLATPVAIAAALFMSEVAGERARIMLKFVIELLAGVPSVVYGLLGVLLLRNWMLAAFQRLELDAYSGDTLLTAGVLLAVMILPTLTTLADDGFRSVGTAYRDAARGLGLTRAESTVFVVVRQALPALIGAGLLALGRALGETVAVFLVVGRADNRFPAPGQFLASLVDAGQTITSKLGGAETSIAVGDKLHMSALLALGLVLLITVLSLTAGAELLRSRLMRSGA